MLDLDDTDLFARYTALLESDYGITTIISLDGDVITVQCGFVMATGTEAIIELRIGELVYRYAVKVLALTTTPSFFEDPERLARYQVRLARPTRWPKSDPPPIAW